MMRLQCFHNSAVASFACIGALAVLGLWGTVAHALTISPVLVELSPYDLSRGRITYRFK